MDFPVVKIASNPRHLGKMKKGGKVRMCGGGFSLALLPQNHKRVMKAIGRGLGAHHALTGEEIAANHGRGFFDDIKGGISDMYNEGKSVVRDLYSEGKDVAINTLAPLARDAAGEARNFAVNTVAPAARDAGKILLPLAKQAANKAIDYGMEYGPDALGAAAAAAATASGNPEFAPAAYSAGRAAGKAGGQALGGYAKRQINDYDPYNTNAPPSRQPRTTRINAYTGQNIGALDRANMGAFEANMDLSQLEALVAQKRAEIGQPHFDYSGGRSMSQYADAMRPTGRGLYAGMKVGRGMYGGAIFKPRNIDRQRREVGSVGIQGNLLGMGMPPALSSQPHSANFQFRHTLPPAFQKLSQSGDVF